MPMPGFFNTNNPTPWANNVPQPPGYGGLVNSPLVAPTGVAPAPVAGPSAPAGSAPTAPSAPAPAPAAPAPAPAAPAAPALAGNTPPDFFGAGAGSPTTAPPAPSAVGGMPDLQTLLAYLQNPGMFPDPFQPGSTAFLPGRSYAGEEGLRTVLNYLFNQMATGRGRSDEAAGIYRAVANTPPAALDLSRDAVNLARQRIEPGALSGYRDMLRSQAASDAGQGYQTSMQRMRDAGLLGRGGMSVDPALAASNQANQGLSRQNLAIESLMEELYGNRLGQANDLSRSGADVYQNLRMIPAYNLAQRLDQQQYPGDQPFINALNEMSIMGMTGDQAARSQPNDFERIGAPILGGVLSGASGIGDLVGSLKDLFD